MINKNRKARLMALRRASTRLKKQLRGAIKERKQATTLLERIKQKEVRIRELAESMQDLKKINKGITVKEKGMDLNKTTGIWIVTSRNSDQVEMKKFFEYIREINYSFTLSMNIPKKPIGPDGLEVTFNKGDLLCIDYMGDNVDKGKGFHFANVGPADDRGKLQYELALYKLGVGTEPQDDKSFLVVDGTFRKMN